MRNAYVDRLRGAAILIVLLGHSPRYIGEWTPVVPAWSIEYVVKSAYYGVTMFFVVSGYLITSKFLIPKNAAMSVDLRVFYIQRIGRIIPPLLLLLSASALVAIVMGASLKLGGLFAALLCLVQLDLGGVARNMPHTESSLDALWSLQVEETFYVFMPIIVLLLITRRNMSVFLGLAVGVAWAYRTDPAKRLYGFFATFDQLSIGALVAIHADRLRSLIGSSKLIYIRVTGVMGMAVMYFTTKVMDDAAFATLMAGAAALYIIGARPTEARSILPFRVLESFGRLSYEIYLSHMMVFCALASAGVATLSTRAPRSAAVGLLAGAIGLTYVISVAVSKLYSEPLNRAIRSRFGDKAGFGVPIAGKLPMITREPAE
jgi:peptidoglycan/LPS O-acetylase OafA/YrhL